MQRKILIGYEPTSQGDDALALGAVMAEIVAATPLVARVMRWPRNLMSPEDLQHALRWDSREQFAIVRDRFAPVAIETKAVANQSPAAALSELADEEAASLIVIGSAHRGSIGRVLLGTTGTTLLHGAPCAVAVAPRGFAARESTRLGRIGVAFDGSAEAWIALRTGIGLAERLRAELTIVTVADPARYGYSSSFSILTSGELHDFELEERKRGLDLAMKQVPEGLIAEARILRGDAAHLLTGVTREVDLMVTGSRGYGPIQRTLLGSTSSKLLNDSACPTLVLPRGISDPLGLGPQAGASMNLAATHAT
jgi:nucleotide-binding universal stress UspA family protein